ncbi:MAG: SpoVK/Ycf46/Vps4 family AAA+-type ATPase [Myxococcota bacterium]
MDDNTYDQLWLALEASPQNLALFTVLGPPSLERRAFKRLVDAIESLDAKDAPVLVLYARALHGLRLHGDALRAYERGIALNSTLEDPELRLDLEMYAPVEQRRERETIAPVSNPNDLTGWVGPEQEPITFADVGGLEDLKKRIRRKIILPMQKPTLFQRFKKKTGGGVLMYGAPGCGKTLMARATAGECGFTFINVQISDVLDMYIGQSEAKLHALFERARQAAPAVLFFDEIEALGAKRGGGRSESSMKLVSQFLAEMDGFSKKNEGVLILGATNVPWAVDSAFRRPGRFDRVLFVPPPDHVAREAIFAIHVDGRPGAETLQLGKLAKATSGYSGADIEHVVETAADIAIEASLDSGEEVPLSQAMLNEAVQDTRATTLEWLSTARNYARYANESGQYDDVLALIERYGR